ncbi:hypothetical protein RRG08_056172 [Elysia crispata]|uniref:Uncharacterized protein n=1 Tax=Elysia crispata TaxID=231223 RepID=A0AAE0Z1W9_9GAST|nr:hypothetical protein RRG08_056172 [Elysia crispata]
MTSKSRIISQSHVMTSKSRIISQSHSLGWDINSLGSGYTLFLARWSVPDREGIELVLSLTEVYGNIWRPSLLLSVAAKGNRERREETTSRKDNPA